MSHQRQAPKADRRSPIRKAVPTRESSSGPGHRIASARDIAIYFREDCRTLRDALQLEMVVAQYHLQMQGVRTREGLPVGGAASAGIIAELEQHGDPLSHAILRGLAHVGTGETARRSAESVDRLRARGIGLPPEFADVTEARAFGAWRDNADGVSDEYALFVDFEYSQGARHSIAVFVEPRHGGVVKHIGLMGPMSDLDPDDPLHPNALTPVEIGAAGALLHEVLDRSYGRFLPDVDDYRVLIAFARARTASEEPAADPR